MSSNAPVAWKVETDAGGIAWLTFDKPGSSTNVLSRAALLERDARLSELAVASPRGVVIRSGKTSGFVAGADVKEFSELQDAEQAVAMVRDAKRILARLEALPCHTVAIVNGFALGGG